MTLEGATNETALRLSEAPWYVEHLLNNICEPAAFKRIQPMLRLPQH